MCSPFAKIWLRNPMEEHVARMISEARMNASTEGSESNSYSDPSSHPKKRLRIDNTTTSFMRFKGVVLQQNGHWGAQIYANHQRIWLGTFKSEKEAAMAYDSAAIKLRSGDSHRNFPWTDLTVQEVNFQDHHTTESVLNMIKDGSYQSKFTDFLRTRSLKMETDTRLNLVRGGSAEGGGILCQQLFQKELTPSDVGKLNRLVIPKKHAIKYFPQVSEVSSEEEEEGNGVDDVQLVFFDRLMKSWKFRYCYWKSSQSFVFTRGWNRFVKEKELKAKDVITFYRCEYREALKEERTFCMIEVGYNRGDNKKDFVDGFHGQVSLKMELQLSLGQNFECGGYDQEKLWQEEKVVMEVPPPASLPQPPLPPPPPPKSDAKGVRLFGVQIC
ncbi:AP2/ERF and B3 domain-containing transcription factor At1g51120-like [Telopea speciosissima]|uniref:AP2/ERF and B3 domain-containing transcription factor At1g51120-like n=1 Tax=Telopea speciosissima TaxID=54955 RepID=UPI001CC4C761|nr:AP2/ERF and B3 domain-containing transcription factor At1g51120-like [Telopea speciosissima]